MTLLVWLEPEHLDGWAEPRPAGQYGREVDRSVCSGTAAQRLESRRMGELGGRSTRMGKGLRR